MVDITIQRITSEEDLKRVAASQIAAFESSTEFTDTVEPPPQAPKEDRIRRLVSRFHRKFKNGQGSDYVGWKAVNSTGEILGVSYWRRPGHSHHTIDLSKMSEEEKESYKGMDVQIYENLMSGSQKLQDQTLAEKGEKEGLWYLEVLGVTPKAQGKRIGPRLLDHHLALIDAGEEYASRPAWLESSPAGFGLYTSRGVGKVTQFKPDGWEKALPNGMPVMYRPRNWKRE